MNGGKIIALVLGLFLIVAVTFLMKPKASSTACKAPIGFKEIANSNESIYLKSAILMDDPYTPDEPILVNFWATWCPPCVKELPLLDKLKEKFPKQVMVINLGDSQQNINNKFTKLKIKHLGTKSIASNKTSSTMKKLNIVGIPSTFMSIENYTYNQRGQLTYPLSRLSEWINCLNN